MQISLRSCPNMLESDLKLNIWGLTVPTMVLGINLTSSPKLRTKTAWFGVNWVWLSKLSLKTLTSCFGSQCAESNSRLSVYK